MRGLRRVLTAEPGVNGASEGGPAVFYLHLHLLVVQTGRPAEAGANALGQGVVWVGPVLVQKSRNTETLIGIRIRYFQSVVHVDYTVHAGSHIPGLLLFKMRAHQAGKQRLAPVNPHMAVGVAQIRVAGQGGRDALANVLVGHQLRRAHLQQVVHIAHPHHVAGVLLGILLGAQVTHRAGQRHHSVEHLDQGFGRAHPRVKVERVAHGAGNGLISFGGKLLAANFSAQGPVGHEEVAGIHAGGARLVGNGHDAVFLGGRAHGAREVHHLVFGAHLHQGTIYANIPVEQLPNLSGNFLVGIDDFTVTNNQVVGPEIAHAPHAFKYPQH